MSPPNCCRANCCLHVYERVLISQASKEEHLQFTGNSYYQVDVNTNWLIRENKWNRRQLTIVTPQNLSGKFGRREYELELSKSGFTSSMVRTATYFCPLDTAVGSSSSARASAVTMSASARDLLYSLDQQYKITKYCTVVTPKDIRTNINNLYQ